MINALKSMLQEDDVIGPEDVEILDKINQFAEKIEMQYPPARLLFSIIDNKVWVLIWVSECLVLLTFYPTEIRGIGEYSENDP